VGINKCETRCMAITGTLVRHFIDARMMTLNAVIANPSMAEDPTVLVIPNLYMMSFGKQLTAWQMQTIYDVLLARLTANKPTVVCVENMEGLRAAYGPLFADHLEQHFKLA
jgi:hypothetical protein